MRQRDTATGDRGDNYPVQRHLRAAPHTNMMNAAAADNNRVSCEMTIHQINKTLTRVFPPMVCILGIVA